MKTVILEQPGCFEYTDTLAPTPISQGQALVKVHKAGICGKDFLAYKGRQPFFQYPRILGHELGVEILEIPNNELGLQTGDHCVVEPYLHCGTCIACRRGKPNCCVDLQELGVHVDGGMREFIAVPFRKLHKSDKLDFEQLALVESICVGAHAVGRAGVRKEEYALVIGTGPIGLGTIEILRADSAKVIVMDINSNRLAFCRDRLGIRNCVHAGQQPLERVREITNEELCTAVFDCTGNPQSMGNAIQYMAHGGRLVFVGTFIGEFSFYDPEFYKRETTLLATRNSTPEDFKRVIRYLENGTIDATPWITHRATAENLAEEFETWLDPNQAVIKPMVDWA